MVCTSKSIKDSNRHASAAKMSAATQTAKGQNPKEGKKKLLQTATTLSVPLK